MYMYIYNIWSESHLSWVSNIYNKVFKLLHIERLPLKLELFVCI